MLELKKGVDILSEVGGVTSIEQARSSKHIDRVVVSTDDDPRAVAELWHGLGPADRARLASWSSG